jgi:hypothetical protein
MLQQRPAGTAGDREVGVGLIGANRGGRLGIGDAVDRARAIGAPIEPPLDLPDIALRDLPRIRLLETTLRSTAASLPLVFATSNETFWPSLSTDSPAFSMVLTWT